MPLVSTIVPVHNRPAMLREAVASVLAQTYRPIEIVIVDDASTDETPRLAEELAAREPSIIRVVHRATNGGAGAARETGRLAARGDFIQYLDSDDVLLPFKFELQVAALLANPEAGVAYGRTRVRIRGEAQPHPSKRSGERMETMFPAMLQLRWWDTLTPLYRADVVARAGAWLPLRMEEDWEYDARIAAMGTRLTFVDEWVCEWRSHGNQLSGRGLEPPFLADRAIAHARIYEHAVHAGIANDAPEMQHFARELFLLARQCGAAGLRDESAMLFRLAREASTEPDRLPLRAYAALARVVGWNNAGRLACMSDRLR